MTKNCRGCDQNFEVRPDDADFYEKMRAPAPNFCPDCRMQRRLAHRNERTLYRRQCDLCKKEGVSIYPPQTLFPVYCNPCWWSDNWDGKAFAMDYDPGRPFMDQYKELQAKVPRIGLLSWNSVNSEYTNNSAENKNCYLMFATEYSEDCSYGRLVQRCKSTVDACFTYDSELCYECVDCRKCYQCLWSERCQASSDLLFCFDVRDSQNCILCVNLRHKQYCIENVQYTKEEYEKKKLEILASHDSVQAAKKRYGELRNSALVKYAFQTKCKDAAGDYLYNCHEGRRLFDVSDAKACYYMADAEQPLDCRDGNNVYYKVEKCLDLMGVMQVYDCKFCTYIFYSTALEYCDNLHNCTNCIGSISLKKANYCILNKEYSKEDYDKLKPQIVAAMQKEGVYGDFLPPSVSPLGYNETLAKEYFSLSKDEATAKGFNWQDQTMGTYGQETVPKDRMPATIEEVQDSITNEVLGCAVCGKNFKITPSELAFYRRLHLPLPRLDFECRHQARMAKRTPRNLWSGKCQCGGEGSGNKKYKNTSKHFHAGKPCPNEFQTAYAPDRPEVVYCEECYQAEVA